MNEIGIGERAPWNDFPQVVRNGNIGSLKKEPEYQAAKAGNRQAALQLVYRLLTDETVTQIEEKIGNTKPLLLPVIAIEGTGNNKIPLAMAEVLADRLDLKIEIGIIQQSKVFRTHAGANHRLAFNPTFIGDVKPLEKYLIIDDTLTMGGTIASLRGYVENRGGQVIGATVMNAHEGSLNLPIKPKMLAAIEKKHGPMMNQFFQETFGYGIEKLTQGEAGHLRTAKTIDDIRNRITQARHEGISLVDASRIETPSKNENQSEIIQKGLISSAESLEVKQESILAEQTYQKTLSMYIQTKHDQVETIENRLKHLINQQQSKLQQTQSNHPSFFSMPKTRRAWQTTQSQQQGRLQTLHTRLDTVREIKEGMGLYAPCIEALATRKMRKENPILAKNWDLKNKIERHHQICSKTQKHQQSQKKNPKYIALN